MELSGRSIAILVENNYQEMEVWYPIFRFQEGGAEVSIIGPVAGRYLSKLGYPVVADTQADMAKGKLFDALIIPGGFAPDLMRLSSEMIEMVGHHVEKGRVVAAICHGSWMLASANAIRGKRVTGAPSIKDDLNNAGGHYEDAEVVCDGNLITSRKPSDLPAFCRAIVSTLASVSLRVAA
ncbi:MAG: type 1 glutamine amidotransferase domain-containing protein [Sulfuritalea sp.]|nr:type 1 glutamine amidotransferase domain-containing protein [Sulfuritalea sp.]